MTSLLNVHLSVREVVNDVASSPPGPVVPAAVGVVVWSVVRAIRDVIETEKSNFGFYFLLQSRYQNSILYLSSFQLLA